ncbi:MAG: hypothetical protein K5622_05600, partial [Endomicrobiaceae bacterium]|nr:hypothetical protein [Endomicrobiaceae bacterium]
KIKFIDNVKFLDKYKNEKHIYWGSEFCEKKLFTLNDLKNIVSKKYKQKITLVFPYLTQTCLDKAKKTVEFVSKNSNIFIETVFNDWGLFYFIRNNYPDIKLVLGRLLTKQKTDPFAYYTVYSKQSISSSKNNIFVPKQISEETKEYFSQTLINSKIFQKFMTENNIVRVELDNVNWKMNIKLPKQIKASVYYPYVKITTTRHCSFLNMSDKCKKQCEKQNITLNKYRVDYNYVIRGNSVNYKNIVIADSKELEKNSIDRIIIND